MTLSPPTVRRAAIELAKERSEAIHLLITDVVMPEMNGRDLADALLAIYPESQMLVHVGLYGKRHRQAGHSGGGRAFHPETLFGKGSGGQGA